MDIGSLLPSGTSGSVLYADASSNLAQVGGTATQVLHGGTPPSFGLASLTTDVSGVLPTGNGGTGNTTGTSTINANLTGPITSVGNATSIAAQTGTGTTFVMNTAPTVVTSLTDPLLIGGTAVSSTLALRSTSGVGSSDALLFQVGNNGATEAMRITTAGNVGIGTTGPLALLDVNGVGAHGLGAVGAPSFTFRTNLNTGMWSSGANILAFSTAGVQRVTIDNTGGAAGILGVGKAVPAGELHVKGGGNTRVRFERGGAGSDNSLIFSDETDTGFVTLGLAGAADGGITGSATNDFYIKTQAQKLMLGVARSGLTPADLVISTTGNVGIGTASPTNLFSLNGQSARVMWMERQTTANTAGNTLTITAGGASSGATDKAGGDLLLTPGISTGTGGSGLQFQTSQAAASTSTADNALTTRLKLTNSGHLESSGTIPTIATNDCGSTIQGTVTALSTDVSGTLTAGTATVTSCAMTFAKAWTNAPNCVVVDNSTVLAVKAASTTTKLTVTASSSMSSDVLSYICVGNS